MAKQPNQQFVTKKHLARLEKERIQQRYLLIGSIVVFALVIGIILFGVLDQTVIKAMQPVAKVGTETINTSSFQKEVRFERYRLIDQLRGLTSDGFALQFFGSYIQQIQSQLENNNALGQQVLNTMIEDILVRREAESRGITVTEEEVEKAVQEAFNFYAEGTPTPTVTATPYNTPTLSETQKALFPPTQAPTETAVPTESATPTSEPVTPTPEATATATSAFTATPAATATITLTPTPYTKEGFEENLGEYVDNVRSINYSREDLRNLIRRQLLRQKVYESVSAEVETSAEQVWARHILVETEEEAKTVLERLNNGETFADLARELSTDESNKNQGGDLGWFTRERMVTPFADAAFSLKEGEISQPVKTDFGYHIIQVIGHEERPLDPAQLDEAKQKAYSDWLEAAKTEANVETYDENWTQAVPTDPEIPVDLQAILQQISTQNQGLPLEGLP